MSIPLVRNNTKDAINTSIIAIKKNLERINTLLGLVDSSEPDLSGLATKQELEDTVTEINNTIDEVETSLQPVDTVTSGNMHSVTSNAVANYANKAIKYKQVTISPITIGAYGYADIRDRVPSGMNNFLFALLWSWGSNTSNSPIAVETDGQYLWGQANTTCYDINVRYYYTD
jgi:hypothetical protein